MKKEKMKKRKLEDGGEEKRVEGAGIDRPKKKKFKVKFGKDGKIKGSCVRRLSRCCFGGLVLQVAVFELWPARSVCRCSVWYCLEMTYTICKWQVSC